MVTPSSPLKWLTYLELKTLVQMTISWAKAGEITQRSGERNQYLQCFQISANKEHSICIYNAANIKTIP